MAKHFDSILRFREIIDIFMIVFIFQASLAL